MNWLGFALVAWILAGMEIGLKDALRLGPTGVAPSFLVPLAVLVAMLGTRRAALAAALCVGALLDLTAIPHAAPGSAPVPVLGPYALGLALAAQLIGAARTLTITRHPLTFVILTLLAGLVMHVAVAAIFTARELLTLGPDFPAGSQLLHRAASSLYTAVVALPLGWLLLRIAPLVGLPNPAARRGFRRAP